MIRIKRVRSQFPNWKIYKEKRLMKEEKYGGCGKSRERQKGRKRKNFSKKTVKTLLARGLKFVE